MALTVPGVPPGSIPLVYPSTPFVPGHGSVNSLWLPVTSSTLAGQLYNYNLGLSATYSPVRAPISGIDWTITGAVRHEHKTGYQSPTPWKSAARLA